MCGRFLLTSPVDALGQLFLFDERPNLAPRYNVAPSQDILIVRRQRNSDRREVVPARWGLVPFWAKDAKIGYKLINARAESVASKPAFREAFQRGRRCLIPADGFYEWQKAARGPKQPWLLRPRGGGPIAFAGLFELWRPVGQEPLLSCTILTTGANSIVAPLHDRMPVILPSDGFERWLAADVDEARGLLAPCPGEVLEAVPVSIRVNSPNNDDPSILGPDPAQRGLPL
jgi:putative SOS response-associated peptidase YedK